MQHRSWFLTLLKSFFPTAKDRLFFLPSFHCGGKVESSALAQAEQFLCQVTPPQRQGLEPCVLSCQGKEQQQR